MLQGEYYGDNNEGYGRSILFFVLLPPVPTPLDISCWRFD